MFIQNWLSVLVILAGLGLAGAFATLAFEKLFTFPALLAPMFGLLFVTLGALAFYVIFYVSIRVAATASWAACSSVSCIALWHQRKRISLRFSWTWLILAPLVAAIETGFTTATSIRFNEPSIIYREGTDHLGYAQLADWLLDHKISHFPLLAKPELPYESFPNLLFSFDPRFGSYSFLSIICAIKKLSGAFTYDLACAVGLSCGILAVSAVFARSRMALVLLCIGLLTCHWMDYSRYGFFAKALAFPATFFVAGLFFASYKLRQEPVRMALLAASTAGAAILLSGYSTGLFLSMVGIPFLLCVGTFQPSSRRPKRVLRAAWVTLGLMVGIAILSSGALARPLPASTPDYKFPWDFTYLRIADLESQALNLTGLNDAWLSAFLVGSAVLWVVLGTIAFRVSSAEAVAVIVGPIFLLVLLRLCDRQAIAFQMIGVFYPLALCGGAILVDTALHENISSHIRIRYLNWLIPTLTISLIFLHVPRCIGAVQHWCIAPPESCQFVRSQIKSIARIVGSETLDVDVGTEPHLSIMILVELGEHRRLQWSQENWNVVVGGYRQWPTPSYESPGRFRLVQKSAKVGDGYSIAYSTNQYLLLKRRP
jgi:hypothetical protein